MVDHRRCIPFHDDCYVPPGDFAEYLGVTPQHIRNCLSDPEKGPEDFQEYVLRLGQSKRPLIGLNALNCFEQQPASDPPDPGNTVRFTDDELQTMIQLQERFDEMCYTLVSQDVKDTIGDEAYEVIRDIVNEYKNANSGPLLRALKAKRSKQCLNPPERSNTDEEG